MRFDYIIGNPPYQDEAIGDNKTFAPPIYHKFLENAYKVGDVVELIHPARFLFNAGNTPKQWNRQMLEDPDLKVLTYEPDSKKVFPNTEIKGGVAVTYHQKDGSFGAIGTFTPYQELNSIFRKVDGIEGFESLSSIVVTSYAYHFTDTMHKENPDAASLLSKGHAYDLKSNVFDRLPMIFLDEKPDDGKEYVRVLGRANNSRAYKYIRSEYINEVSNLKFYKVFLPSANGSGGLGETLAAPLIGEPGVGYTETFISLGCFDEKESAEALLKYVKTKFARALFSILKVTQHITVETWSYVPMQDFGRTSDIDWKGAVSDIDMQLYQKYGLTDGEIRFVESKVKEMD
ncbi:MAG: hypothetical protein BACD_00119 [Bacteroides rodentium]